MIHRDELYKIQSERMDLDPFIRLILRSYTGVFSDYVNIDEGMLANRSGLSPDNVYQNLKTLAKLKIIHYIPRRKLPAISYEKERIDQKRIKISPENYQLRKIQYQQQVDSVIHYASQKDECRSRILLSYFGQNHSRPCGTCDVCKGEHESGMSYIEFHTITEDLKKLNLGEKYSLSQLCQHLNKPEKKILQICRWLLDREMLQTDHKGGFFLSNKL